MAEPKNEDTATRQRVAIVQPSRTIAPLYLRPIALLLIWLIAGLAAACQQLPPELATATFPAPPTSLNALALETATAAAVASATPTPTFTPTPPQVVALLTPTPLPNVYLPVVKNGQLSTPIPTPTPTSTFTPDPLLSPTPTPPIDFALVRQQLQAQGQDIGFAKIGFHVGIGGTVVGLDEWMQRLDSAGVPFFLKSADNAEPIFKAQNLMQASGVPHVLVFRTTNDSVPDYNLSPEVAAAQNWALHKAAWPPELDPSLVWIATINEVDKERSEWLAEFALITAQLAISDGFKWAAFSWASGEPEVEDWQSPPMVTFLRFAAANPDRVAIALHEYSYTQSDIRHQYPYKLGRFQQLFNVCDQYNIARPTVLITEWGWEYNHVPAPEQALQDIAWAARMYAFYPQIKGAAIWFLGGFYDDIDDETQRLIQPVTEYSLRNYFVIPLLPALAPIDPEQFR